jgi:hypothetical protein
MLIDKSVEVFRILKLLEKLRGEYLFEKWILFLIFHGNCVLLCMPLAKVKSLNATDSAESDAFHILFSKAESGLYTVT